MMNDFTQLIDKYLDVTIPYPNEEGNLSLKLCKPSERLNLILAAAIDRQLSLVKRAGANEEISIEEQLEYLNLVEDVVLMILNNNREGINFEKTYQNTYFADLTAITQLLQVYEEFIRVEINNHPN